MKVISLDTKVLPEVSIKTVEKPLLETIGNPVLQSVIKERVYQKNDSIGYHDDSTCSYTCHSDDGE